MFDKYKAQKKTQVRSIKKVKRFIGELNHIIRRRVRFGYYDAANWVENPFTEKEKNIISKYYEELHYTCKWTDSDFFSVEWKEENLITRWKEKKIYISDKRVEI